MYIFSWLGVNDPSLESVGSHSCIFKYLLSIYYLPATALNTDDIAANKTDRNLYPLGARDSLQLSEALKADCLKVLF